MRDTRRTEMGNDRNRRVNIKRSRPRPGKPGSGIYMLASGGAIVILVLVFTNLSPGGSKSSATPAGSDHVTSSGTTSRPLPPPNVGFSHREPSEAAEREPEDIKPENPSAEGEKLVEEARALFNEAMAGNEVSVAKLKAAIGKFEQAIEVYRKHKEGFPDDRGIDSRLRQINRMLYRARKSCPLSTSSG